MIDFTKFTTDEQIAKVIIANFEQMKTIRQPGEALRTLCSKLFLPRRWDMLRTAQKGQQFGAKIYDQHPANSSNKFVLGFLGYMISRAVPWLAFGTSNREAQKDDNVKQYLQEVAEQVLWSIGRSNFYGTSVWLAKDATVIGSGTAMPEENLAEGKICYQNVHPGEAYLADDRWGKIGIFIRPMNLDAMTLLEQFEESKLPADVLRNAKAEGATGNPFVTYPVLYAYYKNVKPVAGSLNPEDYKYKTFYILLKSKDVNSNVILQKSGTNTAIPNWRPNKEQGWPYGISLAAETLTAALQVNKLSEKTLEDVHKKVEPPLRAHKNLRGNLQARAGGRTWFDKIDETVEKLYDTGSGDLISKEFIQRIDTQIEDAFYIRFFEALRPGEGPQRTAYEVSQLKGQTANLMTSLVSEFEEQYLEQIVQLHFDFETKTGRMPTPPDILFDQRPEWLGRVPGTESNRRNSIRNADMADIDISYIGPLAQVQKSLIASQGIIDGLALANQIKQMWPNALIKINELELIEDALIAQNFPQSLFKTDDQMEEIFRIQEEKEQAQEQAAMMIEAAKVVPNLQKASEAGSPLEALAGAVGI